jgi:hypothetical protein
LITATGADVKAFLLKEPYFASATTLALFYKDAIISPETPIWELHHYAEDLTLSIEVTRFYRVVAQRKSGVDFMCIECEVTDSFFDGIVPSALFERDWQHGFESIPDIHRLFDDAREAASPRTAVQIIVNGLDPEFVFILPDKMELVTRIDESTPIFEAVDQLRGYDGTVLISGPFFLTVAGRDILRVAPYDSLRLAMIDGKIAVSLIVAVDFSFVHRTFTGDRHYVVTISLDATCTLLKSQLDGEPLLKGVEFSIWDGDQKLEGEIRPYFAKGKVSPVELWIRVYRRYRFTPKFERRCDAHTIFARVRDGDASYVAGIIKHWAPSDGPQVPCMPASAVLETLQAAIEANPAGNRIIRVTLLIP